MPEEGIGSPVYRWLCAIIWVLGTTPEGPQPLNHLSSPIGFFVLFVCVCVFVGFFSKRKKKAICSLWTYWKEGQRDLMTSPPRARARARSLSLSLSLSLEIGDRIFLCSSGVCGGWGRGLWALSLAPWLVFYYHLAPLYFPSTRTEVI